MLYSFSGSGWGDRIASAAASEIQGLPAHCAGCGGCPCSGKAICGSRQFRLICISKSC